jgi:serine/threonine protein kinase
MFKPEFLKSGDKAPEIFRNEIKALLALDHPNIVKIHEYGVTGQVFLYESVSKQVSIVEDSLWYLVLEYVS